MPKKSHMQRPRRARRGGDPLRSASLGGRQRLQNNSGFPERLVARLSYMDYRRVNPGVVASTDTVYSLNSVFDPEVSGVGHQPRSFDALAALYGKYRVRKVHAVLHSRQRASHGLQLVLVPSNSSTALTAPDYPGCMPRSTVSIITSGAQPAVNISTTYDCADVLGQTHAQYQANEDTSALVTASPAEQLYLHVFAHNIDLVTVLDYEHSLLLTYDVEFFDRKFEAPSSMAAQLAALQRQVMTLEQAIPPSDDDASSVIVTVAPRQPSNFVPPRRVGRPG